MEPDHREFSGNVEGLQMTASNRTHSRTDLNRIDETHSRITVEEGDLMVNEKNIDRQSHTRHSHPQRAEILFGFFSPNNLTKLCYSVLFRLREE